MPSFEYIGRTKEGKTVKGTLRASSAERARALLKANNISPLEVTATEKKSVLQKNVLGGRPDAKDLVLLSRQLSAMITAGVPILEAIRAQNKQAEKDSLKKLLSDMSADIEGGGSLSDALSRHGNVFSPFFIGVVKTGEASGRLAESLATLADYLEQNYIFMRKVKSALTYPAFVLVGVVIVVALMFVYIVPQLTSLFDEAAVQLPLATRIMIGTTNLIQSYWYVGLLLLIVGFIAGRSYLRTRDGHYTISALAVHTPLVRGLATKLYLSQLTSILHTLFKSDVAIVQALEIGRDSIGNAVFSRILDRTLTAVKDGAAMSEVWETEELIPPMLTTMVAVGEKSGDLAGAFVEGQRFFKRDVDDILATVTTFLEPILVIILGIAVGLIVAGVLLPIYNLVLVL